MKKEYIKPQMEIVEMEMQQLLLLGISGLESGSANVGRKRYTSPLWDDDEIE